MPALLSLFFITIFCFSNHPVIEKEKNNSLIVYEVFIQSFADSDKNGIGDLRGLISKLDYIQDLGANAIWIMPVHPSPSYHKYDITDYYAIHPDYGTMEDMDELIREVHRKGMKLIMDLVINHTSAEHPWFKASVSSPDNPYHDYYVWRDFDTVQDEINKKETTFDSDNITQWHQWDNEKDRYYAFFWKGMPDLNFDNPAVREETFKIGKFWLDKGIDGFRLDAARHIFPDDRFDDTRLFWEEFRNKMEEVRPGVLIIGEVWSDPKAIASLFKGIPSLFNFELTKSIPECIVSGNAQKFITDYSYIASAYQSAHIPYTDALLLSNHDMNRIRSVLGGEIAKAKLAASILLTLPGTPYIYYGEEIGMLGMKPDEHIREPFLWYEDAAENTLWLKSVHSVPTAVASLVQQKKDPASIYHHYKKWIQLRRNHPEMASAQLEFVLTDNHHVLAYTLTGPTKKFLVIHNLSGDAMDIPVPEHKKILSNPTVSIKDGKINIDPYSSILVCL
jgi:glycosidase